MKTNLESYQNADYNVERGLLVRTLWYFINGFVFKAYWIPISSIKVLLLRLFGAKIGRGVNIKPNVNIKYPWKLSIGDFTWIGEGVWIDNLAFVSIGNNCCISQEALLLCGNHDYKQPTFDLITKPIVLEDGAWIGAKGVVCPGVIVKSHAVLAVQSVATKDLQPYEVYQGNPAEFVKTRL